MSRARCRAPRRGWRAWLRRLQTKRSADRAFRIVHDDGRRGSEAIGKDRETTAGGILRRREQYRLEPPAVVRGSPDRLTGSDASRLSIRFARVLDGPRQPRSQDVREADVEPLPGALVGQIEYAA